jgi:hypothetical protein
VHRTQTSAHGIQAIHASLLKLRFGSRNLRHENVEDEQRRRLNAGLSSTQWAMLAKVGTASDWISSASVVGTTWRLA